MLPLLVGLLPLLGATLGWHVRKRRAESSSALDELRAVELEDQTARNLGLENRELRTRVRELEETFRLATDKIADLERVVTEVLIGAQVANWKGIGEQFDHASDGWTLTTPANGGTFKYASRSFCAALGMGLDEFLACDWRTLVVEKHRAATKRAEAAALSRDAWGFRNEWHCKGGGSVPFEWYARSYPELGGTLSLVLIGERISE